MSPAVGGSFGYPGSHRPCGWTVSLQSAARRMFGVSRGSFSLQGYLNFLQRAGQSEADAHMEQNWTGGGGHNNWGLLRQRRRAGLEILSRKVCSAGLGAMGAYSSNTLWSRSHYVSQQHGLKTMPKGLSLDCGPGRRRGAFGFTSNLC